MKYFSFILFLMIYTGLTFLPQILFADELLLKNGHSIEGIINTEDEEKVELDVGFGTVTFRRSGIKDIFYSGPEDKERIVQKWEKRKLELERLRLEEAKREDTPSKEDYWNPIGRKKEVRLEEISSHLIVEVLFNKRVRASLVLDTGATLVLITDAVAKKLRMDTPEIKEVVHLQFADGTIVQAKYAVIDSMGVQGVAVQNVPVAILPPTVENIGAYDGLLGMSFLRNFNFKVDQQRKKLFLERLR